MLFIRTLPVGVQPMAYTILSRITKSYRHDMTREMRDTVGRTLEDRESYVVRNLGLMLVRKWAPDFLDEYNEYLIESAKEDFVS